MLNPSGMSLDVMSFSPVFSFQEPSETQLQAESARSCHGNLKLTRLPKSHAPHPGILFSSWPSQEEEFKEIRLKGGVFGAVGTLRDLEVIQAVIGGW